MTNAEATIRSQILDAIASSADQTGLRAGPPVERLVDAIYTAITDSATRWALRDIGQEDSDGR